MSTLCESVCVDEDPLGTERAALLTLFKAWGGKSMWNRTDHWCEAEVPVSSWYGVDTNEDGSVVALDLQNNFATGDIAHIATAAVSLPNLAELLLSNNALSGLLPASLAAHPTLSVLDVSSNLLVGALPDGFIEPHDFRWLATSDNQLSMFIHCDEEKPDELLLAAAGAIGAVPTTTEFAVDAGDHPLARVYLSEGVLSPEACADFVRLSEACAARAKKEEENSGKGGGGSESSSSGWQTARHRRHATTDVDCGKDPALRALANVALGAAVLPLAARLFGVPRRSLLAEDVFVVKYTHDDRGAQRGLGEHRDGSDVSFIVLLSDPESFAGGGTVFSEVEPPLVVKPFAAGDCVSFCGRQRHAGAELTRGTRYVLAGFLRVFDGRRTAEAAAELFCACDGEPCAVKRRALGSKGRWGPWRESRGVDACSSTAGRSAAHN